MKLSGWKPPPDSHEREFVGFWVLSNVEKLILEMRLVLDPSDGAYFGSYFIDFRLSIYDNFILNCNELHYNCSLNCVISPFRVELHMIYTTNV